MNPSPEPVGGEATAEFLTAWLSAEGLPPHKTLAGLEASQFQVKRPSGSLSALQKKYQDVPKDR